ncbi:hypothetical protein [Citreimonas salinaria]|uniref:Uncharacterized protein n=1 Tax=Citreimonas salinaria TaxID=321339 RepID=A0A1H3LMH0_9RHOB|nr:hypothetical protein [Citreimonas salinaria]SDY65154.1 hypothetical protein SAMN05444340_11378 [Citreimonas salinaria]
MNIIELDQSDAVAGCLIQKTARLHELALLPRSADVKTAFALLVGEIAALAGEPVART